jgi:hypothetical protein
MANLYYVRPDEVWSYAGAVADTAGATDSDYTNEWLCDGRAGRPARATSGTVTWTITNPSAEVGLICVANSNSNVNATIGGSVSATVTAGALGGQAIRKNGFATVTPAACTTMTVGFSGASASVVVGEVIAGKYRTLTRPVYTDDNTELTDFARAQEMDLSSIPPYDPGLVARTWSGSFIVTSAEKDDILAWYEAQRGGTRPSLVVPQTTVNDAWVCFLQKPSFSPAGGIYWTVQLSIVEVPRVRWP